MNKALGLSTRRLEIGIRFGFHVMALVDCLDAEIGEEADHEQPGHDVHGGVVRLRLRHAVGDVVFADVQSAGVDCETPNSRVIGKLKTLKA